MKGPIRPRLGQKGEKVTLLDEKERVEELARMAGGREVTEKARVHARALLKEARKH